MKAWNLNVKRKTPVEKEMDDSQSGFSKEHTIQDCIHTIHRGSEVHVAFLDPEKTYDTIPQTIT